MPSQLPWLINECSVTQIEGCSSQVVRVVVVIVTVVVSIVFIDVVVVGFMFVHVLVVVTCCGLSSYVSMFYTPSLASGRF